MLSSIFIRLKFEKSACKHLASAFMNNGNRVIFPGHKEENKAYIKVDVLRHSWNTHFFLKVEFRPQEEGIGQQNFLAATIHWLEGNDGVAHKTRVHFPVAYERTTSLNFERENDLMEQAIATRRYKCQANPFYQRVFLRKSGRRNYAWPADHVPLDASATDPYDTEDPDINDFEDEEHSGSYEEHSDKDDKHRIAEEEQQNSELDDELSEEPKSESDIEMWESVWAKLEVSLNKQIKWLEKYKPDSTVQKEFEEVVSGVKDASRRTSVVVVHQCEE